MVVVAPAAHALSRHYLGLQCSSALQPFCLSQERLCAVGAFEQDAEQHRLAIIHLRAEANNSSVKAVELAAWVPPAAVTCTAATQVPPSSSDSSTATTTTLLAAGCADGSLCRLRISFPRALDATIAETSLNDDDFEGTDLVPWRERLHSGAITSVAVSGLGEASSVATSGSDGSIVLTPVASSSSSRVLVPQRPAASISSIAWAGAETLAACGTASPVELFDVRSQSQSGRPVSRAVASSSSSSSSSPEAAASLLRVHTTRPNLAATGGRKGIALWDLRFLGKGAVASLGSEKSSSSSSPSLSASFSPLLRGGVTGLAFDPLPSAGLSDSTPRLLFSTGAGVVGSASLSPSSPSGGGGRSDAMLLYREAGAAALALAVEPSLDSSSSSGRDVFVSTDQECLIYLQRALV